MLPKNLVLVRHGQSEFNHIVHKLRNGEITWDELSPEVFARRGSKWRLTNLGREQAEKAGEFIRNELGVQRWDGYFVSDYIRAKETAAGLKLEDAEWKVEPHLRERDWGEVSLRDFVDRRGTSSFRDEDAFYGAPPSGESIANVGLRFDRFLDTLHREYADKNVIVVCHGEFMWSGRVRLERLLEDEFLALDKSRHPFDRIHNCQIIHYRRVNTPYISEMRHICPWDLSLSSNHWQPVTRKKFTNSDLMADVDKFPPLITNE